MESEYSSLRSDDDAADIKKFFEDFFFLADALQALLRRKRKRKKFRAKRKRESPALL